jgi:hypothetical protein
MSKIPDIQDPTLLAVDAAMEAHEATKPPRQYLGASGIGHACERKSWLDFRHASPRKIDAKGLRRIQDGFAGEQIMIDRLRMAEAITLVTHQNVNEQIGIEDHGGHFRGHLDGMILGLLQAPVKWHVWECKVCDQKKIDALAKLAGRLRNDEGDVRAARFMRAETLAAANRLTTVLYDGIQALQNGIASEAFG